MNANDLAMVRWVGQWARRFPEEWQTYQDWLRAILASRDVLFARYPGWQAAPIFYWRLLYFVLYFGLVVLSHWGERGNQRLAQSQQAGQDGEAMITLDRGQFIWRRTATILAMAALTLSAIAAITGILLSLYYEPTALGAHRSLQTIANSVSHGNLILSLHHIAGNGLIGLALVQMLVLFLGRQWQPAWLGAWVTGIGLTMVGMALSWTAIILDWDQTGFWRFKLELNMIGSVPVVGTFIQTLLMSDSAISTLTVQRMYTLHGYGFAIAALVLAILHLTALVLQEQQWKGERFRGALFSESM